MPNLFNFFSFSKSSKVKPATKKNSTVIKVDLTSFGDYYMAPLINSDPEAINQMQFVLSAEQIRDLLKKEERKILLPKFKQFDFTKKNFEKCSFSDLDLSHCDFTGSNLTKVNFENSNLTEVNFSMTVFNLFENREEFSAEPILKFCKNNRSLQLWNLICSLISKQNESSSLINGELFENLWNELTLKEKETSISKAHTSSVERDASELLLTLIRVSKALMNSGLLLENIAIIKECFEVSRDYFQKFQAVVLEDEFSFSSQKSSQLQVMIKSFDSIRECFDKIEVSVKNQMKNFQFAEDKDVFGNFSSNYMSNL